MIGPQRAAGRRASGGGAGHAGGVAVPGRRRSLFLALMAVVLAGAVFSQRSPDPLTADPVGAASARAALATAEEDARHALAQLQSRVDAALAQGRMGAALTVAGADRPGPHLRAAADALQGGGQLLGPVVSALDRVAGQLSVLAPGTAVPRLELSAGEIDRVAAQLAASADAADAFRAMRDATQGTLAGLGEALAALEGGDPAAALDALDAADRERAAVEAWPGSLATLPIWIETTGKLLAATRAMALAAQSGDVAAGRAAEAAYRAAAADAHQADLALSIAISQGGADVSGAALTSLAGLRDTVAAALDAVDGLPAEH